MKNSAAASARNDLVRALCLCLGLTFLCLPATADADKGRTLGGYRFIPSSLVEDPFITTHFRNSTGLAFASSVKTPVLIIDSTPPDTLLSFKGSVS